MPLWCRYTFVCRSCSFANPCMLSRMTHWWTPGPSWTCKRSLWFLRPVWHNQRRQSSNTLTSSAHPFDILVVSGTLSQILQHKSESETTSLCFSNVASPTILNAHIMATAIRQTQRANQIELLPCFICWSEQKDIMGRGKRDHTPKVVVF